MNYFDHRVIKTALGTFLAIYLAQVMGISYGVTAGIVTIISIQTTKKESVKIAIERFIASLVGLFIAAMFFYFWGYTPFVFGLFILIFMPVCLKFNLFQGFLVTVVLATHILTEKNISLKILSNEILILVLGAVIAIVLNLYMPDVTKKIKHTQENVDNFMKKILSYMSDLFFSPVPRLLQNLLFRAGTFDGVGEGTYAFDGHLYDVILQNGRNAGRRPCKDDVSGHQRHDPGKETEQIQRTENHVPGIRGLTDFAVHKATDGKIVDILKIGLNPRSDGAKRIVGLAMADERIDLLYLTGRHIVGTGEPEQAFLRLLRHQVAAYLAHDHRQLRLMLNAAHARRQDDRFAVADNAARGLEEKTRHVGQRIPELLGVRLVVEPDTNDLGRRYQRKHLRFGKRYGFHVPRLLVKTEHQPVLKDAVIRCSAVFDPYDPHGTLLVCLLKPS